jgi:hypothetical protein
MVIRLVPSLLLFLFAASASAQRPVMERVRPAAGPPGTQVQLIGRHFGHRSQVFLGDAELRVIERRPNRWTLEVPPDARSGPILLRTRRGTYSGPRFRVTEARPAPQVTGIEPPSAAPGSEVTLVGASFSTRLSDNHVTLAGEPVVVRSATPSELRVLLPADARSGTFEVRVDGATAVAQSPRFEVTVGLAVTAVEPPRAPAGAEVVLRGTGFSPQRRGNRVTLAGRRVRVLRASSTELAVRLPRRGVGSGNFEVSVRGGGTTTSPRFVVADPVVVRDFSPRSGPGRTEVTIQGSGFGRDIRQVDVKVGDQPVRVRVVTSSTIRVRIPPGAPSGPFTVSVGGYEVTSEQSFHVLSDLEVGSFEPRRAAPGTEVTIHGQGFAPDPNDNVVSLGPVRLPVLAASPQELRVRIVDAAPSGPFQVASHGERARSRQPFVVLSPPSIRSFSPQQGPSGTEVTIVGSGFGDSANLVRATMGRRRLRVLSVRDDRLVVRIPRRARTGRITIEVGTRGGTVTGSEFRIGSRQRVSGLSPDHGLVGSELTIRGENFPRADIRVAFTGPRRAVRVQRVSPVELRVIVPNGAQTGPVELILPRRRVPLGTFTVGETPEGVDIASVEPECSYPGCRAVLHGHGFDGNPRRNRVQFRGERVEIRRATTTALEIVLPERPGNGRFTVDVVRRGRGASPPFFIQRRPRGR